MEVIVSSVADAMLSACFRSLCETLSSPDFLKFTRDERLVAEMNKWQKLLLRMNASLDDAEEKQITSRAVKHWLRELQHVAFDAEDVLAELTTEALRRKLTEHTPPPSPSIHKVWKFIVPPCFRAINLNTTKFDAEIKPFSTGAAGSKLLVTTRNESVAAVVASCGGYQYHHLKGLSNDDCLSILTCHALGAKNFDEYPNLKAVAKSVSGDICFNLEDTDMLEGDKLCTAVEKIRYFAFTRKQYDVAKRFEVLHRMKKLRTLAALPTEASSTSFPSLNELNVEDSNEELLGSIIGLSSSTTLITKGMPELQHLQNGVVRSPGALKVLSISNCIGLTSLWSKGDVLSNSTALEHLKIKSCPQFVSLAENECGLTSPTVLHMESCQHLVIFSETGFFPMIKHLTLDNCRGLKFFPSAIMMLNCPLEELEIIDCPALTCFPSGRLPTALRRLKIRFCGALVSLPQGLMQIDNGTSDSSHLENLEIISCPSLVLFPEGKFPSSLKILTIWKCFRLEPLSDRVLPENASLELIDIFNCTTTTCLPECVNSLTHLTELNLQKCVSLQYFPETGLQLPNLRKLDVYDCISLESLPDQMQRHTSLQHLTISECPGLVSFPKGGWPPNLLALKIWNCENLKQPLSEWNLQDLASLRDLTIAGAPNIVSFPDEMCLLPTSLMSLYLSRLHNLQSLSVGLCDLTLLKELEISECPKLQRLPKEGLPAELGRFCIWDCQLLTQYCLKDKGAYWPMIAHIPCLEIETTDD
ncbi:hypothetical protein V6N11_046461 [Hibiscus sabdariffa]|uniref:Uncharacterized protein n=2 Tax=Hibiscus sabdariffa TaxID=183260 RepID=A0ABR2BVK7_9ROSI